MCSANTFLHEIMIADTMLELLNPYADEHGMLLIMAISACAAQRTKSSSSDVVLRVERMLAVKRLNPCIAVASCKSLDDSDTADTMARH